MPRGTEQARLERRRQLVAEARLVFADKGYHRASINDIIKACDIARGTFYNYFDSKREIFDAILGELFELLWSVIKPIDINADIPQQIAGNLQGLMTVLEENPDLVRILFSGALGLDPQADNSLADFFTKSRVRLARALAWGQELGIVADGNPQVLAVAIIGIIREYWFHRALGVELMSPEEFLAESYTMLREGVFRLKSP